MNYLFFDTETTGIDTATDRIVQLAAILTSESKENSIQMCRIIKPKDFTIPEQATKIHGITTAKALKLGIPLQAALYEFDLMLSDADHLVAHNLNFDLPILLNEMTGAGMPIKSIEKLQDLPRTCTMKKTTQFCGIKGKYTFQNYKWPKLQELHKILFGEPFDNAHDALADVRATARCFFELKKRKII